MTVPADTDRHRRDRAVLAAAVAAVLLTSALIVFTVLKAERDGEIEVAGPDLARSLTELGLIDEYRIYLHPVVLGEELVVTG